MPVSRTSFVRDVLRITRIVKYTEDLFVGAVGKFIFVQTVFCICVMYMLSLCIWARADLRWLTVILMWMGSSNAHTHTYSQPHMIDWLFAANSAARVGCFLPPAEARQVIIIAHSGLTNTHHALIHLNSKQAPSIRGSRN